VNQTGGGHSTNTQRFSDRFLVDLDLLSALTDQLAQWGGEPAIAGRLHE
jgi:hypothetical protein